MKAVDLIALPPVTLLALSATGPLFAQGEIYTNPRLPPSVYRRVTVPQDRPSTPEPPPPPDRDEDCNGFGCPPTELEVGKQLLNSGPDTQNTYPAFESAAPKFAVVGFARESWPLSIEYQAEPDTVTVLRIKLYHRRRLLILPIPFFEIAFEQNLDALPSEGESENEWRRTVTLPAGSIGFRARPIPRPPMDFTSRDTKFAHTVSKARRRCVPPVGMRHRF